MSVVVKNDHLQTVVDLCQAMNVNLNPCIQGVCVDEQNLCFCLESCLKRLSQVVKDVGDANRLVVKTQCEFF